MIKLLYLLLTCLFLSVQLNAQVEPPIIRCITSDTLFYTPVTNSCGPFLAYEIFRSTSPNGPFAPIGQITDEAADLYIDANSATIIQYYFIRPVYDCPGATVINSDTVSNRPPEEPILQTVSVVNGVVELSWEVNPSPEVVSYAVFLVTDTGLELLGDSPTTTFTDSNNDPNQMSFTYLIAANDDCGIQSVFGAPISSVFLSNEVESCIGEVNFVWNRHLNVESQELWLIDGTGQSVMVTSLPADAEEFTTEFLPNVQIQGFFIRSFTDVQAGEFADSNISLPSGDVINFIDEIYFTAVQTLDDNSIAVEWCWDGAISLLSYDLRQDSPSGSNTETENISGSTLSVINTSINANNTAEEVSALQVTSSDVCDRFFDSEIIRSIVLEVAPVAESTLEIEWSSFDYPPAFLINYQLHEVVNGEDNIIFTGTQTRFTRSGSMDGEETCYYVEAIAEGNLLDGSPKTTVITSNNACTTGFPIIRLPNAFNPYGINSIFRPLFGNTSVITQYEMNVFSRYGEQLFFTNVLDEGWDGRSGLREMPQGVYSYLIKIDIANGQTLIRQGSVLLIR